MTFENVLCMRIQFHFRSIIESVYEVSAIKYCGILLEIEEMRYTMLLIEK